MPSINPTTSTSIAAELSSIVLSRNPLSILFGIARIRELIEDFADDLLSSIEKSYYTESATRFIELIELYEKNQFYTITAAAAQGSWELITHQHLLDAYFEESYYRDVDFYFFVLNQDPALHTLFHSLASLCTGENQCTAETLDNPRPKVQEDSVAPLSSDLKVLQLIPYQSLYNEAKILIEKSTLARRAIYHSNPCKLARDLYLSMISSGNQKNVDFWKVHFIQNSDLQKILLQTLSTQKTLECFAFLRNKLLKAPKYNLALSDTSIYRVFMDRARTIEDENVESKLSFIADMNSAMGSNSMRRDNFTNILRKGLAFQGSGLLVDAILGVTFLRRPTFFEVKRRTMAVDFAGYEFASLREVTGLISLLESSTILRFLRPFFISRLAKVFTKEQTDLYHFIKFILTIHHPKTYGEYLQISQFFLQLEANSQPGITGMCLRFAQYGWVGIALIILFALAPFWVTVAVFGYLVARAVNALIARFIPRFGLVSNFQLTPYFALFGALSLSFALSFGMRDNIHIVYSNYRTAINAVTLITSETLSNMSFSGIKASLMEANSSNQTKSPSKLEEVDYLKGSSYRDLQNKE